MTFLKLLIGYFLPWLCGYLVLFLLDSRAQISRGYKIFAALFLGSGIFTMQIFLAGSAGLSLSRWLFLGVIAADLLILASLLFWQRKRFSPQPSVQHSAEQPGPTNFLKKGNLALILLGIIFLARVGASFWQVWHIPTFEFDAWNNWNLRGKVIFTEQHIPLNPANQYYLGGGIKSYPLHDGLEKVWLASLFGTWREQVINTSSTIYYLALLGLFYCSLPKKFSKSYRLLATYLLGGLPFLYFHSWIPYDDLSFAGYLFLTATSLFVFLDQGSRPHLYISALALAFAVWTKNEGFALVLPVVLGLGLGLLAARKFSLKNFLIYWAVAILACLPWLAFRFSHHLDVLSGDSSGLKLVWNSQFFGDVFSSVFLRSHFNFLWLLVMVLLIYFWRPIWQNLPLRFLSLFLVTLFVFYNGVILFTDKAYDLSAAVRVNLHIAPLAFFLVTLLFEPIIFGNRK